MCELLGMSFNKPVKCEFSFQGFTKRSTDNPDGWGIALYPGGGRAAQVLEEPLKAGLSELAGFVKDYPHFCSNIFLSHIRCATSEVSYANTHPFVREFNGREYAFAHNGQLFNYKNELSTGSRKPIGSTDSEFSFCHLLNKMEDIDLMWNNESFADLETIMREINQYGNFNCLFTDGEYLFCYRDKTGHKGLCYTERRPPYHNSVKLVDDDIKISLQEVKGPDECGIIVATKPLTGELWRDICPGTLIVFRDGEQIFPAHEKDSNEEKILHALYKIRTSPHRVNVFIIANTVRTGLDEVNKVLKPLVDKGLIRQDSRDCKGPFDLDSTYYTVRDKRDEIDQLLREDMEKVQISEAELDFSGAGNSDRVSACVNCSVYYKKGTTFCRKCLGDVVDLDKQIADIIFCLNGKGYKTEFCCVGHRKDSEPYIRFAIDIDGINLPLNFVRDRGKNSRTFRMIPYHKAMGITRKKMQQTVNEEVLEQFRLENLEILRNWAKDLPTRGE